MAESIENNWSARALDRQISTLYYERLLSSKEKKPVIEESNNKTQELKLSSKDMLRDPYIFDFLNLPHNSLVESDLSKV
jgi:predicted nuclease of restriction endonuclease-like (RecB) superfamily